MSLAAGITLSLVAAGAVAVAAAPLSWMHRLRQPRLDVLAWGFLTAHLMTTVMLVLGTTGALRPWPVLLASLGLAILAAAALGQRGRGVASASLHAVLRSRWQAARRRPLLLATIGCVVLLQLLRELAHVLILPPYVWDTLTYHLPRIPEWIQSGRLLTFESPNLRTYWPANHELLQLWLALFPQHDAIVEAAGMPFHALAAGSVYASARSLAAGRAGAAIAAIAYACCPAVALQATSAKNDLPITASFLFCVALLLDLRERRVQPWRHLGWMLLVLGFALGTKPYIVFLAPGLLLLSLGCVRAGTLARAPRAAWRVLRVRPLLSGAACASVLLVALSWYGRNAVRFGDPFYPTNLRVLGRVVFEGEEGRAQQNTASLPGLARNLRMTFRRKVLDDAGPFTAELAEMAGWGWFVFAVGPPCLLLALASCRPMRWVAGALALSLATLFAWVAPDPWNLRFVIWFPALAALAFAVAWRGFDRAQRMAWGTVAACTIGLDLVGSLAGSHQDPALWRAMAGMPLAERSSAKLGLYLPYVGAGFEHALRLVPPAEPIGYHTYKDGGIYPLYGADLARRLIYVPIVPGADVAAAMRASGVRFLFVTGERHFVREQIDAAAAAGRLRPLQEGLHALP